MSGLGLRDDLSRRTVGLSRQWLEAAGVKFIAPHGTEARQCN
jgi:hypothetical protein